MFSREVLLYTDVLPKLGALGLGPIAAPLCYHGDADAGFLVMEDLGADGFALCDKKKELGVERMRMVLEVLARLHAASYHFVDKYPGT